MRYLVLCLSLLVLGVIGWQLWPANPEEQTGAQYSSSNKKAQTTSKDDSKPGDTPSNDGQIGELVDRPVRNVTPPDVTQGPELTGPPRRVPGPFSLKPRARPAAKIERYFKPVIVSADTIETISGTLVLSGVEAPNLDAVCPDDEDGWPCGRMARSALQRFIRGRAVECRLPAVFDGYPASLSCTVGGQDISRWLIEHGWAKPEGKTYAKAAELAKEKERGLWSRSRPDYW